MSNSRPLTAGRLREMLDAVDGDALVIAIFETYVVNIVDDDEQWVGSYNRETRRFAGDDNGDCGPGFVPVFVVTESS